MADEREQRITEVVERERSRLSRFVRRRVADAADAEDVLQDVFFQLAAANRLLVPIEHVTAWLFRVARNRIIDRVRKQRPVPLAELAGAVDSEDDAHAAIEEFLPSPDAGPEALFARRVLLDELEAAIEELPDDQREVFVAHELEGRSFKDMAAATGVSVNTLLARKRYAVLRLRARLRDIHDAFTSA